MIRIIRNSLLLVGFFLVLSPVALADGEPLEYWEGAGERYEEFPAWNNLFDGKFAELDDLLIFESEARLTSHFLSKNSDLKSFSEINDKIVELMCVRKTSQSGCKKLCENIRCRPVYDKPSLNSKIIGSHSYGHLELFNKKIKPSPKYYRGRSYSYISFLTIAEVRHIVTNGKIYEWARVPTGALKQDAWIQTSTVSVGEAPKDAKDGSEVPVDFSRSLITSLKHSDALKTACIKDINKGVVSFYALVPNIIQGIPSARDFGVFSGAKELKEIEGLRQLAQKPFENRDKEVEKITSMKFEDEVLVNYFKETEKIEPHLFKMSLKDFYLGYLSDYVGDSFPFEAKSKVYMPMMKKLECSKLDKFYFKKIDDLDKKRSHLQNYSALFLYSKDRVVIKPKDFSIREITNINNSISQFTVVAPSRFESEESHYRWNIFLNYLYPNEIDKYFRIKEK